MFMISWAITNNKYSLDPVFLILAPTSYQNSFHLKNIQYLHGDDVSGVKGPSSLDDGRER